MCATDSNLSRTPMVILEPVPHSNCDNLGALQGKGSYYWNRIHIVTGQMGARPRVE